MIVDLTLDNNEVQVNCSQLSNYESRVQLLISVNNEQNDSITCRDVTRVATSSIHSEKFNILYAYYQAPERGSECTIVTELVEPSCQGMYEF